VNLISKKYEAVGNLTERCNVTESGSPAILKGASFFTDLGESWLGSVVP